MSKQEEIAVVGTRSIGQRIRISPRTLLVAIVMAVCLWLYVNLTRDYTTTVDVRVNVVLPEGRALEEEPQQTLRTRLKGRGWQLLNAYLSAVPAYNLYVSPKMLSAVQTMQQAAQQTIPARTPASQHGNLHKTNTTASFATQPDTVLIKFDRAMLLQALQLPQAVTPLDIVPDSLLLNVGTLGTKKVPILPRLNVRPRNGFIVTRVTGITPDSVELKSGKKILKNLTQWFTQPIDQHDVHEPFTVQIPLSDTLEDNIKRSKNTASISVDVQQYADMVVHDIPVQVQAMTSTGDMILLTRLVNISVRGGINDLAKIAPDDIRAIVRYEDMIRIPQGSIRPRIELPLNISLMAVEPQFLRFTRRAKHTQAR
jgi:hypothetical protein